MSDPFIAEIRIFAGNFAPRGWAFCDGQLLQIAQNTAVFAIVGTIYGGDGRTTLGLPNLKGRAPMHPGNGPGLTPRRIGNVGGIETVPLTVNQIPNHTHTAQVTSQPGNEEDPRNDAVLGAGPTAASLLYAPSGTALDGTMDAAALPNYGVGQEHNNMQPFLTLNFIFALQGLFPSRS
jgi:microcystin-dependent protein